MENRWKILIVAVLFALQSSLFFIIPSMGASVFLSPDETANAVAARAFGVQGSMKITDNILRDGPWLRPRSFVTQGTAMVPVAFLGLPIVLGALWKFLGEWALVLFVPLMTISALFPIWRFLKRFGAGGQVAGSAIWLSFPTVILYANRGLYPNLPVVCLALWTAYLVWAKRSVPRSILAGIALGAALAMRPVEIVWIIPWISLAWMLRERASKNEKGHLFIGGLFALLPVFLAALVARLTYGMPFTIGYFLRDTIAAGPGAPAAASSAGFAWPFGFHPRNVWFNVRSYVLGFWLPWVTASVVAAAALFKKRETKALTILGAWTLFAGAMVYGQAIYQDHVGVNIVSSGNSFLRYLLPIVPFFVLSAAACVSTILEHVDERRCMTIAFGIMVAFAAFGMRTALAGDAEGVLPSATELARYAQIRETTRSLFDPQSIILSERSDKIFFPVFRVASPLPSKELVRSLVESVAVPVAYFSETVDDATLHAWNAQGLDLQPIFVNQNQTMYTISTYHPMSEPQ